MGTFIAMLTLQKLQELLNQSISDNESAASAADKQIAEYTAKDPKLIINLHLQNLNSHPLNPSVSGSILELKNLASKAVFDFSHIEDASFQANLKKSLFQALERSDFDESDLNVYGSLVPNIAAQYVFKEEWKEYAPSLIQICKKGSRGGLIALNDSINTRLLKFENYSSDIIPILKTSFGNPKTELFALNILISASNNCDDLTELKSLGPCVVQLVKCCPVDDLNQVVSKLTEFINTKKDFFNSVKLELRSALQIVSTKQGVLARVKRLSTALVEQLK